MVHSLPCSCRAAAALKLHIEYYTTYARSRKDVPADFILRFANCKVRNSRVLNEKGKK